MPSSTAPTLLSTLWMRDKSSASQAYASYMRAKHFRSLDGLRCISILAVIWHHVAGDQYAADSIFFMGHHGVTLFFVISGFLITSLLLREKQHSRAISLSKFYMRRALRIFPVYYLVLLIYCVLVYVLERDSAAGQSFFDNLIYFATYTSNYFVLLQGDRVIFYFAWSLAAEEQFYMIWPAIEKWLDERFAVGAALLAILVASLASNALLPLPQDSLVQIILENIAIPICVGVLLAHAMHNERYFVCLYRALNRPLMPIVVMACALYVLTLSSVFLMAAYLLFAALVFCAVTQGKGLIDHLFNMKWVIEIGRVSYGMYLFHMLSLNVVRRVWPMEGLSEYPLLQQSTMFILTSLVTFCVARLSFRYFESYFLNLKKVYQSGTDTPNTGIRPQES